MAKKPKSGKNLKRRKVAAGLVAGKHTKAIAREAGCTERHVQRLANEPETQFLVAELMRPKRKQLERLVDKAIAAVSRGLDAKLKTTHDHAAQLRAVGRAKDLLELAEGRKPEQKEGAGLPGMVTWEEFVVMYRRRQEAAGSTAEANGGKTTTIDAALG